MATAARNGPKRVSATAPMDRPSSKPGPTATAARHGTNRAGSIADGPAVIDTRADGSREAWYEQDRLIREETLASLSAIPGVTFQPPPPG
jgi:hypothetical protein